MHPFLEQRRQQRDPATSTDWRAGIARVHAEAASAVSLYSVRSCDAAPILAEALGGDAEAERVVRAVIYALNTIDSAPRRRAALCACCPRVLKPGRFTVGVVLPSVSNPSSGFTFAICDRCGTDAGTIQVKSVEAVRRCWPDARTITVADVAGHA